MVICYHGVLKLIVINQSLLFIWKFWFLLCYFLRIKKKPFTAFHPQTDSQIKRQNSTMKAYLRTFVNWKQNNWAKLLPIVKFAYNNTKNTSIGLTPFKLNCGYYPKVLFKKDVNPRLKSYSADKLAKELRKLIKVYCQNLLYTQELQKKAHNKEIKSCSYTLSKKV